MKKEKSMKKKLGKVGKDLDDSIKKTTNKATSVASKAAKYAGRKVAEGAKDTLEMAGAVIGDKIEQGSNKIKEKLDIESGMSAGEKAGKVVEKIVDLLALGAKKIGEKIDEKQSSKFASPVQLKVNGFDELIGEARENAVGAERAEQCREFIKEIKKKFVSKKEIRNELVRDVIQSASINSDDLYDYLKCGKTATTKAGVDYINREIDELIKKYGRRGE